jgi:hypothetical protein
MAECAVMTRVSPKVLLAAVAANAATTPISNHHRLARMILAYGGDILTDGEKWFLDSCMRLASMSGAKMARLREIEAKVERERRR